MGIGVSAPCTMSIGVGLTWYYTSIGAPLASLVIVFVTSLLPVLELLVLVSLVLVPLLSFWY